LDRFLLVLITAGFIAYLNQFNSGLGVTGMSRDVTWGLYISHLRYGGCGCLGSYGGYSLLPARPQGVWQYSDPGEFLAVAAVIVCMLFVFVDRGQPARFLNIVLHPTPNSIMFWDMCVLIGYLLLNFIIG
jgi:molybdopterin-containing oxidoreductase family membrane subunit